MSNEATKTAKLILENRTDLPMVDFLRLAQEVVSMGRISNDDKQYCYLTAFTINGQEYHIVSDLNEKSDKLTLISAHRVSPNVMGLCVRDDFENDF